MNTSAYHFMNDAGMYDGWEDYKLIVTPSLTGDFDMRITGKNKGDIKEYLYDAFRSALSEITHVDYKDNRFVLE